MKPMINAANVGSTKIGQYFLMDFSIVAIASLKNTGRTVCPPCI